MNTLLHTAATLPKHAPVEQSSGCNLCDDESGVGLSVPRLAALDEDAQLAATVLGQLEHLQLLAGVSNRLLTAGGVRVSGASLAGQRVAGRGAVQVPQ